LRQVVGSSQPMGAVLGKPPSRRTAVLLILGIHAVVVPVVVWVFYAGSKPPVVTFSSVGFSISGGGLYRADAPFADIREVLLQDTIPRVVRKRNGFNAGDTLRGNFTLEVLGNGKIFINRGIPPYVVLRTPDSYVIINFKDPQQTRALYEEFRRHVPGR